MTMNQTSASSISSEETLELFNDSGALLSGHFKLTSGRHSDIYYEKFTILKNPALCSRLCDALAERFRSSQPEIIVGPTLGGTIIAYEVARALCLNAIYAEASGDKSGGRVFKRGFSLSAGEKVLIVDDVLTTGRSLREVIALVKSYEAEIVGIGLFLDRSSGDHDFGCRVEALTSVSADTWEPEDCPLCKDGKPLTQRGSRDHSPANVSKS